MKNLILLGAAGIVFAAASVGMAQQPCECPPGQGQFGLCESMCKHDMANKGDVWAQTHAKYRPWHGNYYYLPYGQPTALVVPPTAIMQQTYSWGVSQNVMKPTYHQFGPAAMPSTGGAFYATPVWPSSTEQFGLYPVRAPW